MAAKHLASAILLCTIGACAQGNSQAATPTLRTQARLVVVDVVVTGKDHAPFHGLRASDFTVFDDGKPQAIRVFEEHSRGPASAMPDEALPPGFFTNFRVRPNADPLNILLVDSLNTTQSDQMYLRSQVSRFLSNLAPGSRVAVFAMGMQLRMVQGFTTDQPTLRASLKALPSFNSPVLGNAFDNSNRISQSDQLLADGTAVGTPVTTDPDAAGTTPGGSARSPIANGIEAAASDERRFDLQVRTTSTFDQLAQLARLLATLPGRKNLVWATTGFPLAVSPDASGNYRNKFNEVVSYEAEFRKTIRLLAQSQTAVYPVDPSGVPTPPSGSASNEALSTGGGGAAQDTAAFLSQSRNHSMMNMIAGETGGRAFYLTNAVGEAVGEALREGASYYTIAFVPPVMTGEDRYRKLSVKLSREGYQLSYRHGYYLKGADTASPKSDAPPDLPLLAESTEAGQILLKARILPASTGPEQRPAPFNTVNDPSFTKSKPPYKRYLIDYAALASDLQLTQAPNGQYQAHLQFTTVVSQPDGPAVSRVVNTIRTTLSPAGYAALAQTGFGFHQEVSVPVKGNFTLQSTIQDLSTGKTGMVTTPLAAVRDLPPAPAEPLPVSPALVPRVQARP